MEILNSAGSGEMLQVVFSFQNSVRVTYVENDGFHVVSTRNPSGVFVE